MAFGMKRWIGATLVGLALVAVWRLPPEPREATDIALKPAESIRHEELTREAAVTGEILYRMMWADSLSARVVAESDDGVAVLMPDARDALEDQRRRFEAQVREQVEARRRTGVDARPEGETGVVFGYVFQRHDHRAEDGARSGRNRTETYVGTREGVDYCLQVRVYPHASRDQLPRTLAERITGTDETLPRSDDLGLCRFYLTHGLAGPGVQAWLEAGALEFARERVGETAASSTVTRLGRRAPLGYLVSFTSSVEANRCLAGIAAACETYVKQAGGELFLTESDKEIIARSPATDIGRGYGEASWLPDQHYLLADLEAELGSQAFGRFWTSELPVDEAFEEAFGVDMGTWTVTWMDRTVGVDGPGPGVPHRTATTSMLTISALLGIAYWRRRERTVVS